MLTAQFKLGSLLSRSPWLTKAENYNNHPMLIKDHLSTAAVDNFFTIFSTLADSQLINASGFFLANTTKQNQSNSRPLSEEFRSHAVVQVSKLCIKPVLPQPLLLKFMIWLRDWAHSISHVAYQKLNNCLTWWVGFSIRRRFSKTTLFYLWVCANKEGIIRKWSWNDGGHGKWATAVSCLPTYIYIYLPTYICIGRSSRV